MPDTPSATMPDLDDVTGHDGHDGHAADADAADACEVADLAGLAGLAEPGWTAPAVRAQGAAGDAQLVAWLTAVADHDERALTALYDATVCRVHALVLRIVRRAALAEEVVEDAYFQVWRQAPRFDPQRGGPMTWLLGMARSRAIDAIRREARFQHDALPEIDGADAFEGDGAEAGSDELLDAARGHAELHRALLQLSAQPRQLVALAFFRGLSHEEIASQTALPLGTVKSQIRRALITLRQVLADLSPPAWGT